jgi:hypothetical protein
LYLLTLGGGRETITIINARQIDHRGIDKLVARRTTVGTHTLPPPLPPGTTQSVHRILKLGHGEGIGLGVPLAMLRPAPSFGDELVDPLPRVLEVLGEFGRRGAEQSESSKAREVSPS